MVDCLFKKKQKKHEKIAKIDWDKFCSVYRKVKSGSETQTNRSFAGFELSRRRS